MVFADQGFFIYLLFNLGKHLFLSFVNKNQMKPLVLSRHLLVLSIFCISLLTVEAQKRSTRIAIKGNQFYINKRITYPGRYWNGHKIEGLLMNSRMVQGIFDDLNPVTRDQFAYLDTKLWDANRNTDEFIRNMQEWYRHGLLAFTLNLQGGSPMGYGNKGWINSAFNSKGELREEYIFRLEKILDKADQIGMVVILGYFYFGQDQNLENEQAIKNATDNITTWLLAKKYKNILIEINNEADIQYDHEILKPHRVFELMNRIKKMDAKLLVSTSFAGGKIPTQRVVEASDFILLHGNGVSSSVGINQMVEEVKKIKSYRDQPILFNEDDHFQFDSDSCHFLTAVKSYASWGYFDYRMKEEGFENGFQSVPVDWSISSDRKKSFFGRLKELTGHK